ncbi:MAG: NADH-quinone oxidoreductase subunit C [Actinomycetota bacterium]|nr:NADH-quinone oxidoreductase subunit C [Actinomycetota bacterium]
MLPDATVLSHILAGAGVGGAEVDRSGPGMIVRVDAADAPVALAALRSGDLDFRMLLDFFGTDTGEDIEITYHLRSFTRDEEVYVKTTLPYDGELTSVWNTHPSALMPERETAELLGLVLSGHPNPKRLFTTDGVAPLLRKSVPIRSPEEVRNR